MYILRCDVGTHYLFIYLFIMKIVQKYTIKKQLHHKNTSTHLKEARPIAWHTVNNDSNGEIKMFMMGTYRVTFLIYQRKN